MVITKTSTHHFTFSVIGGSKASKRKDKVTFTNIQEDKQIQNLSNHPFFFKHTDNDNKLMESLTMLVFLLTYQFTEYNFMLHTGKYLKHCIDVN